jgi:dolichol kinase
MPISVRVLGPLTATLVEFLPLPVDDNLSIPLVSGLVMQVML